MLECTLEFFKSIKNFVEQKDISAAKTLCQNTDNPIARMIEKGVDRIEKPMTDISAAIENQGKLEVFKMENNRIKLVIGSCFFRISVFYQKIFFNILNQFPPFQFPSPL